MNSDGKKSYIAIVPAAGVGKRMKTDCPKQYLTIGHQTVLEHTVNRLLSHHKITHVVVAIGENDEYFKDTGLALHNNVTTVIGGKERADSVLAGLNAPICKDYSWALVHDAARPCVELSDISKLIDACEVHQNGGLLGFPARDTMKRASDNGGKTQVEHTVDREYLWHALTPQMYPIEQLFHAINTGLANSMPITDEASAMEFQGIPSLLVEGRGDNIKITRPDDLAFAEFILTKQTGLSQPEFQASGEFGLTPREK